MRKHLFLILLLPLGAFTCKKQILKPSEPIDIPDISTGLFIQLVNQVRVKGATCGSKYMKPADQVVYSELLSQVSLGHSEYMSSRNTLDHIGLNGSRPAERLRAAGYYYTFFGENIAYGVATEADVFALWMKSPGHCEIIMDPNGQEIGLASKGKYWTMMIGSR
jgi:uncharacterized protein YkwD